MTLPIFVGLSGAVTGTGDIALGMPSDWLPGDILILFVQSSNEAVATPAGWAEVTDSPQGLGTAATAGATRLSVFWRRAAEGDTGVTVTDSGNHTFGNVAAFRGCIESGDPWDVTSGGTDAAVDTSISIAGDTTTIADCLVLLIASTSFDGSGMTTFGSLTNADLAGIATHYDASVTTNTGGSLSLASGAKATAGAYGASTATLSSAAAKTFMTVALKPAASPWLRSVGNGVFAGTTAINISPLPAHQTDDIIMVLVETANEAATLSGVSGWAEVTNSPQGTGTGGAAAATRLTVFWKRAASSSEAAPTVEDSGDHQLAMAAVFRGCPTTGAPWDVTGGGVKASASTSLSITGITTTVNDTLVVALATHDFDVTSTAQFSAWANSNLVGVYERIDSSNALGNGGGIGMATGRMASAGATGATTATLANSSVNGFMHIALKKLGSGGGARSWGTIVG